MPDTCGLHFDFSLMKTTLGDPQLWSLATFTRLHNKSRVIKELEQTLPKEACQVPWADLRNALVKLFMEDDQFETDRMLIERAEVFRGFMKEYLAKNQMGEGERVAVVCHSKFIASLTATGVCPDKVNPDKEVFGDHYWPQNCEIQPYKLY